jgi:23S rRNA (pseudouridine1915-N3)-methyltransferase
MKMTILAIGRLKAGPEKDLCDEYLTRARKLGRTCGITGLAVKELAEASDPGRVAAEAKILADALPPRSYRIVLDERGRAVDTLQFAALIRRQIDAGTGDLAFLIGGADGHAEQTRTTADFLLSLGPMTWPHRLVRAMLSEQIYRAVTIMVNHPYHRL